jgi:hypothetical protein
MFDLQEEIENADYQKAKELQHRLDQILYNLQNDLEIFF